MVRDEEDFFTARQKLALLVVAQASSLQEEQIEEASEADDEEEENAGKMPALRGFTLIFDIVRRFAQPLGIRLPGWEGRVIETKKGVVRLLSIRERARVLFGREGADLVAQRIERARQGPVQLELLLDDSSTDIISRVRGRRAGARAARRGAEVSDETITSRRGTTTLDRAHTAMLLQAAGHASALRALLRAELERGPDFLRLANALSALYPKYSEEKRLVDAMLLAVPKRTS